MSDGVRLTTFLLQTVYAYLHCARRFVLHKLAEITKMLKNTRYMGSRSFKVIECGTNRRAYTIILVTNSGS